MRADPLRKDYLEFFEEQYDSVNYNGRSLASRILGHSHKLAEKDFGPDAHFGTVLEVGAGHGEHLESVRHGFDRYIMTDLNSDELARRWDNDAARARGIEVASANARTLEEYPEDFADRLIASHVLEHLPEPHAVLRQWSRVVKPGGTITVILPCDPGFAWRFGRNFGPRRQNHKAGNHAYDYWMAREHVNAIQNLWTFIDYYFPERRERWFPAMIPSYDLNLIFAANLTNRK